MEMADCTPPDFTSMPLVSARRLKACANNVQCTQILKSMFTVPPYHFVLDDEAPMYLHMTVL